MFLRWILLALGISGLFLWMLLGCAEQAAGVASSGDGDSDSDTDGDSDSDSDVDIEYPEFISPYLDLTGAMTGPISPPPEDFGADEEGTGPISPPPENLGDILAIDAELPDAGAEQDDWDAGVLEDED